MSNKQLAVLAVAAVVMVVLAAIVSNYANRGGGTTDVPTYLIQGLDSAEIGSIVIKAQNKTVTLSRENQRFVVVNKEGYPASLSAINNLITSCLDVRTAQLYTDKPENHRDLGVTEEDARAVVKFLRPEATIITGMVLGKEKETGEGSFVRLATENKVYLMLNSPLIKNDPMDYVDRQIVSVAEGDIKTVAVSSAAEKYTIQKEPNSENYQLDNLPQGKKIKNTECRDVFMAVTRLRFSDVGKSGGEKKLNFDRTYTCELKDSTVYTFNVAEANSVFYVKCSAVFGDTSAVEKKAEVESEAELKKKEAKLLGQDNTKNFNARHEGWIYQIDSYIAKDMTKKVSDLIEDVAKPKESTKVEDVNDVNSGVDGAGESS